MIIRILIIFIASTLFLSSSFARGEVKKQAGNVLKSGSVSGLYNRVDWVHWVDVDGDCQDARAEVLIRQSSEKVSLSRNGCAVVSGYWFDPYTGTLWAEARDLDIDHVVSLSWANGHGGSSWAKYKKRQFANDMENLIAVEKGVNRAKGDKGADEWLPPRHQYRCEYLKRFDKIVNKYDLKYAPSEKRVLTKMQAVCAKE